MKIGIVTLWNTDNNYGGILQTYALQRYLRNQGHDAYVIRMLYGRAIIKRIKGLIKRILIYIHVIHPDFAYRRKVVCFQREKQRNFPEFRRNFITLSTKEYHSMRGLRLFYPKADCYITGSDQVWAMPLSNPKEAWHYLDFGRAKTRRISYAASFGHNEFPEEDRKMFVNYIKKFDKISVREESGLRICNSMGFDANRCVDSTLLLDKNEYVNIMSSRKHFSPYAFIYSVNMTSSSDIFWGEIKDDIQKLGLNTIVTTASGYAPARELFGNVNYDYVTPNEWLSNIYYSEIILTSSFHGVVFSLIFKKNFVYFPLSNSYKTGNDRITDLLKLVNLGNRTATDGQSAISLLNSNIDYSSLDFSQLNNLIKSSKDFITL